ncbi:hypothetical protein NE237_011575 [Protea cynaroides]|uniref:Uncharacterized protein n=1 Tax=Protea cynaroides TaxID=273540 RepID=A0A9Q0GZD6_9MAGN|nr:hypothetical protein NE237_011575 [Protea cynaroides]
MTRYRSLCLEDNKAYCLAALKPFNAIIDDSRWLATKKGFLWSRGFAIRCSDVRRVTLRSGDRLREGRLCDQVEYWRGYFGISSVIDDEGGEQSSSCLQNASVVTIPIHTRFPWPTLPPPPTPTVVDDDEMIFDNLDLLWDHTRCHFYFPLLQAFALEKCSGEKCYMIGKGALDSLGRYPTYWNWRSLLESRF